MKSSKIVYFFILALLGLTYSCTKDGTEKTVNESLSTPEPKAFEKHFIVHDKSGNNSVTIRVSSDDETLLTDYNIENHELIINPTAPKESSTETHYEEENGNSLELQEGIELTKPKVQVDIIETNFKNKITNYALVIHGFSENDMIETKTNDAEMKGIFCSWFPKDYQYYDVSVWGATKVKVTFNRTKNTCNNIKYYVCKYNNYSDDSAYGYHFLKHPGDEGTTNVLAGQPGITLLYKHYKNQTPTYTFYY